MKQERKLERRRKLGWGFKRNRWTEKIRNNG